MKIKDGYELNEIAGTSVAIYVGEDESGLKGVINLNKIGVFLWKKLEVGCTMEELIKSVIDKYDIDEKTATKDTEAFVDSLRKENIIAE